MPWIWSDLNSVSIAEHQILINATSILEINT